MSCTESPYRRALWVDARGLASPACPALRQEAAAVGRTLLSRRNAHSDPVLRATRCRDLGRTQPGLAPIGRVDTAATGRGGFCEPGRNRGWIKAGMEFRL